MIFTFIFVILLSSLHANSIQENQFRSGEDKSYMNFFLSSYLNWHKKNFQYRPNLENAEANKFLQKAITEIDQWKTPEYSQLDQFLLGQGFSGGKAYYVYRIYIAKNLIDEPFLKNSGVKGRILFLEAFNDKKICLITEGKENSFNVPHFEDAIYFKYFCKSKGQKEYLLSYAGVFSTKTNPVIKNPFPVGTKNELSIYSQSGIERILYFSKTTNYSVLEKKHFQYIHRIDEETLIPFTKYSINSNNEVIIYYP